MTSEEAIAIIRREYSCVDRDCDIERSCGKCDLVMPSKEPILRAYEMAIKALEQEPTKVLEQKSKIIRCKDCIHNNNCDIQYHAQAGDMFYCGAAESEV